ncbi:MAG: hypothetical protein M1837_005340 [Sclerophora amabilis]|nr:MAG: hypothetical protein M1837_005340 [Sclerophora amabilis]
MADVIRDPEAIKANITHLTYARTDLDPVAIDPIALERQCPLDNGRHEGVDISDLSLIPGLGTLDSLPPELFRFVLDELDIQSLTDFRSVNRRARLEVDTLPPYHAVATHAPSLLRAVLSVQVAPKFSCQSLYDALCSPNCVYCGWFGTFVYLLLCSRVCSLCLVQPPINEPLEPIRAQDMYGLNSKALDALTKLHTIPGSYSPMQQLEQKRLRLVDMGSARESGIALHGSSSDMVEYARRKRESALPKPTTTTACRPCLRSCLTADANLYCYMTVIRTPWLDRHKGTLEWGYSCQACHRIVDPYRRVDLKDRGRMYCGEDYLEHFARCKRAQEALASLSQPDR